MGETKIQDVQIISVTALNGLLESGADKSYTLIQRAPFSGKLLRLTAQSTNASATATLSIEIEDVAVTFNGGSFTISGTSEATDTVSSGGTFSEGDTIELVVSSSSSLDNLSFSLEYERYGSR
jgi:hypothetical protein